MFDEFSWAYRYTFRKHVYRSTRIKCVPVELLLKLRVFIGSCVQTIRFRCTLCVQQKFPGSSNFGSTKMLLFRLFVWQHTNLALIVILHNNNAVTHGSLNVINIFGEKKNPEKIVLTLNSFMGHFIPSGR